MMASINRYLSVLSSVSPKLIRYATKPLGRICGLTVVVMVSVLSGCDDTEHQIVETTSTANSPEVLQKFEGCYAVVHNSPAQIKISQQAGQWVMQMKEPARAKRVWDDPERLEVMDIKQAKSYFPMDIKHVTAMIGRPDKKLVLAQVSSAYQNTNPLVDSQFFVFIHQGENTIYQVPCDDVNMDLLATPQTNIVIEQVQ
ncbi:hypothetical protein [Psychrobacter sp. I-STPA6b]|uniref:hypothetical protein n=1 Tax=Psychrobacter sp. I-STPA6b TaxID=2585718 RepID=UPI001D0C8154|nr:hypothetical protein [Psychrobacter sp. I-STPA6b]